MNDNRLGMTCPTCGQLFLGEQNKKLVEALKEIRDNSSGGPEARSMADNALMELEDE